MGGHFNSDPAADAYSSELKFLCNDFTYRRK